MRGYETQVGWIKRLAEPAGPHAEQRRMLDAIAASGQQAVRAAVKGATGFEMYQTSMPGLFDHIIQEPQNGRWELLWTRSHSDPETVAHCVRALREGYRDGYIARFALDTRVNLSAPLGITQEEAATRLDTVYIVPDSFKGATSETFWVPPEYQLPSAR